MKPLRLALPLLALVAFAADWKPAESPLTTPWTSKVTAQNALPEYPRPQMERKDWINLNGLWDYAVQPKDAASPQKFEGQILVPFAIESALSGVKRPLTPDQRLWYRRTFTAPDLKGKRLLLHFGAVDWRAEVFINGRPAGMHQGGYDPFTLDITNQLKGKGPQEISVSVWDPTDTGLQPRGKQVLEPNGIWYTAVSGIWQTVWLEPVPVAHISALTMTPDVDARRLLLKVESEPGADFTAIAKLNGKPVGRVSGKVNQQTVLPLSDLVLWSPDKPALYDLEIALKTGDRVTSYFGMRKIELRADRQGINRLFLNNQPLFQVGPLDQGWWPDGLYTAPTDEALRFDIETLKKLGFNMARKHVKVEPARYYYWCDKLGFMIWQDMPSAMFKVRPTGVKKGSPDDAEFTKEEDAQFRHELEALIHNLGSTTSIVAWVPFNEGWGQHATNEILKWVKSLDGSRPVDGPSGWEDRGYGDMKDLHQYPGPGMFPVTPDRASVLGEFGGLGLPIEGHLWWNKRNWGYRTFDDKVKLQTAYEGLIDALKPLIPQGLAAAIYTQTTDVEGEVNGLMTYDRRVIKFDSAKLYQLHRQLIEPTSQSKAAGR
jgi:beta-galactosidase/beta-glucuronidase